MRLAAVIATRLLVSAAVSVLPGVSGGTADADDEAPVFDYMEQSFADYRMRRGADEESRLTFHPEPLYQWTVLISGRNDGAVFLWTSGGRPEVVGCVVTRPAKRILYHEFHSLSQQPITARLNNSKSWFPEKPGLQWKPVPRAPLPAATTAQRRIQMRTLARDYRVSVVHQKDNTRWETRMLARPMHEYSPQDGAALDGGLFLFVRANDPQMLLLLEARRQESAHQWQYALARLSSNEIEIEYEQTPVQTIDKWPWRFKPTNVRPRDEAYAQFMMGYYPPDAEQDADGLPTGAQ